MKLSFALTGLIAATLAAGGAAFAQDAERPQQRPHRMPFAELADKDGNISRSAVQADAEKRFDAMDVDHNGILNQTDRDAMHQRRMEEVFARIDADHNGQISKAEFMAAHERHGPPPMPNADGRPGPEPDGSDGPRHHGFAGGRFGQRGPGHGAPDADISKADFVAKALERFDRVDTNHDGKITPQERAAVRDLLRQRFRDRSAAAPDG